MACGCADSTCNCVVTGGTNVVVSGAGTAGNPFVVSTTGETSWTGSNTDGGLIITSGGVNGHSPIINLNLDPSSPAPLSVGVNGLSVGCCTGVEPTEIIGINTLLDESHQNVLADTTSIPLTFILPASPVAGRRYRVIDYGNSGAGNASVNNITIDRNGNTINGAAVDQTLTIDGQQIELLFDGISNWILLN